MGALNWNYRGSEQLDDDYDGMDSDDLEALMDYEEEQEDLRDEMRNDS